MRSAVTIALLILGTLALHAQVEIQIPFDSAGKILVLTKDLNAKVGLFPNAESFVEARMFRRADSVYALELLRVQGASTARERREISYSEVLDLRRRVDAYVASVPSESVVPLSAALDQSGRSAVLWGSTLWSVFYYGTATSIALGFTENENGTATAAT